MAFLIVFDLQFVRAGTNGVLGSIPVVIGTPIPGNGYEFDELEGGEIEIEDNFSDRLTGVATANIAASFVNDLQLTQRFGTRVAVNQNVLEHIGDVNDGRKLRTG